MCDGLGVSSAHFRISMLQGLNICFTSIVQMRHDTLGHPTTNQKDQFKAPADSSDHLRFANSRPFRALIRAPRALIRASIRGPISP